MKKTFILFILFLSITYAQKLEISADTFIAKDTQKRVEFIGNAYIRQGLTTIHARIITLYFNEDNTTKQYEAKKEVRFFIKRKHMAYKGKCVKMQYIPNINKYILEGNVYIKDQNTKREMRADNVIINSKTGAFIIKGNKKQKATLSFEMK